MGDIGSGHAKRLLCRRCEAEVSPTNSTLEVAGAIDHTCTNPAGITYDIRCYASAPGLLADEPPCAEHAWFEGYAWQIGLCRSCGVHLGWCFTGPERPPFAGLIRRRVEERDG